MKMGNSPKWLAEQLGVSTMSIYNWSHGTKRPFQRKTMQKLAYLLRCTVNDLWPDEKTPTDWEYIHELITERLSLLDYRKDAAEFSRLISERAAASVHIYTRTHNSLVKRDDGGYDEYMLPIR